MNALEKNRKRWDGIAAAAAVVVFYGFLQLIGITCPIRFLTGISCAGCGMTRAWIRMLHLDPAGAFHYHPLFFLPPVVLVLFLQKKHIRPRIYSLCMLTVLMMFLIIYFIRLIWFRNEIIVCDPSHSALLRVIRYLKK